MVTTTKSKKISFNQETLDKVVKKFFDDLGKEIDLKQEYDKILSKESSLSRSQRDAVVAIVLVAEENGLKL